MYFGGGKVISVEILVAKKARNDVIMKKVSENAMFVPTLVDLQSFSDHILGLGLNANKEIIREYMDDVELKASSDIKVEMPIDEIISRKMLVQRQQDIVIKAINSTMQISKAIAGRLSDSEKGDNGIEDDLL